MHIQLKLNNTHTQELQILDITKNRKYNKMAFVKFALIGWENEIM